MSHDPYVTQDVLEDVLKERERQDEKWGGPDHDDTHNNHDWIAYIVRHAGRAVIWPFDRAMFRQQMIRVAAIAVAAAEWVDRAAMSPIETLDRKADE